MRSAGEYFRSWFGRFESVARSQLDPWLYLPAAALAVLGLLMVLNTTYFLGLEKTGDAFHFFKLQLCHIGVGLAVLALLSQLSLRGLRRLAVPLMVVAVVMLVALWIPGLGVMRGGARRWLRLGPLLAEPSELAKFAMVFFLADFLSRRQERMNTFAQRAAARVHRGRTAHAADPEAAGLRQHGDGRDAVVCDAVRGGRAAEASGGRGRRRAGRARAPGCSKTLQNASLEHLSRSVADGARRRLPAYSVVHRARRGRRMGCRPGRGQQKMFYLPQAHTDFVFAVVGEEFGLLGAAAVLVLFGAILIRGMRVAHQEPDPFASLLAVGLTALLTLQALVNMAVVIGLVPTKGLPLPFLSYGGTAMVMAMAALGTLLALARRPAVR